MEVLKKIVGLLLTDLPDGFLTAHCGIYSRRR